MNHDDKQPVDKSRSKKVRGVRAEVEDLDAATVWIKALISSVVRDPVEAEVQFRRVPALFTLLMFKDAMARADRTVN